MAHQEHERRYLAIIDPLILNTAKKQDFVQGYLEQIGPKEMRIRIIDNKKAILGTKKGRGKSRLEVERPVSLAAARLLLSGCANYLEKTRYFPPGKTPEAIGRLMFWLRP